MTTATKTRVKDALALLKEDHKKVKELFDDFEDTDDADKKLKIAHQAIQDLKIHATIEEEIFYPALRGKLEEEDLLDEAEEEHRVAKTVLEELEGLKPHQEHFEAKFMVMAENVRHHIKEEEGEMFPQVRETDVDLKELGEQLMARKMELQNDETALEEAVEKSAVKPYQELA